MLLFFLEQNQYKNITEITLDYFFSTPILVSQITKNQKQLRKTKNCALKGRQKFESLIACFKSLS